MSVGTRVAAASIVVSRNRECWIATYSYGTQVENDGGIVLCFLTAIEGGA